MKSGLKADMEYVLGIAASLMFQVSREYQIQIEEGITLDDLQSFKTETTNQKHLSYRSHSGNEHVFRQN